MNARRITVLTLVLLTVAAGLPGCHSVTTTDGAGASDRVVYLATRMTDAERDELRAAAPNLTIVRDLSPDDAVRRAAEFHGASGRYATPEFLAAATNLRWVQSPSAGVERYLALDGIRTNDAITLTNMAGVHGPTIADHAMGMLLMLTRNLRYHTDPAQRGTWDRTGGGAATSALEGRTMFVVGLGGIGREVAQRAKGFGMHVLATRRSSTPPPPFVDEQGTPDMLHAYLARADVVCICLPLTDDTRGSFDAAELALMPRGSYLINVGRGPIVQTTALVAALESNHLAGACLDVTDPEPLPADHVLWSMPNVIITPHVSSRSELTSSQWTVLRRDNLLRFARGAALRNVVDKHAGY